MDATLFRMRRLHPILFSTAMLLATAAAQGDRTEPACAELVSRWVDSDHTDSDLLDRTVTAVLDDGRPGFAHVAARLRAATERRPRAAVESLITRIALGYLNREGESGLVYAGQFESLDPLMPQVGTFFLNLVVATPPWFPSNMRAGVVPALRDLFPKGPGEDDLAALRAIADNREFEPEDLRVALGYALYQWGQRDIVERRVTELTRSAGERSTADELFFVRELAVLRYLVRDFAAAADTWVEFLRSTEALDDTPSALDYYNATCNLSLAGRIPQALAELERCATSLATRPQESSVELTREMFAKDPDLRAIRSTKRFEALVERAFPKPAGGKNAR